MRPNDSICYEKNILRQMQHWQEDTQSKEFHPKFSTAFSGEPIASRMFIIH